MDILQKLVRANALLLQGEHEGAEVLLDSAIVEARALIEENAELKRQVMACGMTIDNMTAEREQLLAQEPVGLLVVEDEAKADFSYYGYMKKGHYCLYTKAVPAQQLQQSPAEAVPDDKPENNPLVIELPPHECAHNPYDGVQKYYQADRLIKILESQGYQVNIIEPESVGG